jgi:hypothetical protein
MIRTATYRSHTPEPKPINETTNVTPGGVLSMREKVGECRSFILNGTIGTALVAVGDVLRVERWPDEQVPSTESTDQGLRPELGGGRHV